MGLRIAVLNLRPEGADPVAKTLLIGRRTALLNLRPEGEKNVENIIADSLRSEFEDVQQQYNVGGYLGLKIDIDIQEEVGIELKLAKDLNTADKIHRAFGQVIYYNKKKYDDNIIFLIVGTKNERDSPMLKEMMIFLEEISIPSMFLKTKGKA